VTAELHGAETLAVAYRKAALNIPNGAFTSVKVDTTLVDPAARFNVAEGFYEVPVEGYYLCTGVISFSIAAEAAIIAAVYLNGVGKLWGSNANGKGNNMQSVVAGIVPQLCKAKDKLELRAFQESGAERALATNVVFPFTVVRVG
jgi:hypothetical protein